MTQVMPVLRGGGGCGSAMVGDTLVVGSPEALDACLTDLFAAALVFFVGGDVANAGVHPGAVVDAADTGQLAVEDGGSSTLGKGGGVAALIGPSRYSSIRR
jgi:hypothetical protein